MIDVLAASGIFPGEGNGTAWILFPIVAVVIIGAAVAMVRKGRR